MHCVRFSSPSVLVCSVVVTMLVAGGAPARGQDARRPGQRLSVDQLVERQLNRHDRNGDGKISADEAAGPLRQAFDRADQNGDGFADKDELTRLAEQSVRRRDRQRQAGRSGRDADKPAATHANVSYGPDERNVLDFWQAKSDRPTPLVVFIHGGGFRAGDKGQISAEVLRRLLGAGISVAAVNYRFVSQAPLPAAHHDCRRALQFLRAKAGEWNVDKTRVGAFGGSAGAQLSMYLAFHDDVAAPGGADPIERESTRLACVATMGGQTTMDISWWTEHVPGYDTPHREIAEVFGTKAKEAYLKTAADISALSLISKDDPPIFMTYNMAPGDPVPDDPARARGWKIHHVVFGVKLKEKMDALGVEADLKYPGAKSKYDSIADFFIAKLKPAKE